MRDLTKRMRLAPDLAFPETRQLAGRPHSLEIGLKRRNVEFEHPRVIDANHARVPRKDLRLSRPVRILAGLEAHCLVHGGDDVVDAVHLREYRERRFAH